MKWQPIETAPKDAGDYLVFNASSEEMFVAYRYSGNTNEWWYSDRHRLQEPPTHWMPLPAPPSEATK